MIADSRDPSVSRTSSSGVAGENGRAFIPAYEPRVCTIETRCSLLDAIARHRSFSPPA